MKIYKDIGASRKLSIPADALWAIGTNNPYAGVIITYDSDSIIITKAYCPDCDTSMVGCKSGGLICDKCKKHCE